MRVIEAQNLEIGQKTCGGLEVSAIKVIGDTVFITWAKGRRKSDAFYNRTTEFEIAGDGGEEGANMAQRVNIIMTSDLSGDEGAETVTFGLDGHTYEIDLTEKESEKMRKALAQYVGAARPVKGKRKRGTSAAGGPSPAKIREWAKSNGIDVPERGRIPESVREEYRAAHGG